MVIERHTVGSAATDQLREMIMSGVLVEGSPLRQDDLAARLGVSRTPLREAIARLEAEGLVRTDPHRGAVVIKPSIQELREVYEIREALEVLAGELAVPNVTPQAVTQLSGVLDEIEAAGSSDEWAHLNTRFHMEMYSLAQRPQLQDLIGKMRNRSELYVRLLVAKPGRSAKAQDEHREILAALEQRNDRDVTAAIRRHLRSTVESLASDSGESGG